MPTVFEYICRIGLSAALLAPGFAYVCGVVVNQKPRFASYFWCFVLSVLTHCFTLFVIGRNSPYALFCSIFMCFFIMLLGFHQRGVQLIVGTMLAIAVTFLSDTLSGLVIAPLFSEQIILEMRFALSPYMYLLNAIATINFFLLGMVFKAFRNLIVRKKIGGLFRIVRLSMMLIIVGILFAQTLIRVQSYNEWEKIAKVAPDFVVIGLLLLIAGSYVIQDIRYVAQKRENMVLLSQRETQDVLLHETRFFRHNIANLLYGLQGTILSRDFDAIDKYYRRMVDICAMINNENVIALRRIPCLPVGTLLLNKIKQANDENVPFYISTDEKLQWRGLRNEDMCQVIGVLIDNALEATRECHAPYMSLELHNVRDGMELIVRNTFSETAPPAFLEAAENGGTASFPAAPTTKPGHEGLGLSSIGHILQNDHRVVFNIYRQGRYVEASMLVGG